MSIAKINDAESARVRVGDPDTNFYAPTQLSLKAGSDYENMWFIKFDLSGISTAGLIEAWMYMYVPADGYVGVAAEFHRCTADWDEGTITWNNAPAVSATRGGFSTSLFLERETWYRAWLSLSEFELMVTNNYGYRARPTQLHGAISSVCSSYYFDESKRPYLKLVYGTPSGQVIIFSE